MWRIVGFISGLALTVGGAGWLVFQLFIAEDFSSNLIVAAVIVLAMGAHWLWTDYVSQGRKETHEYRWHDFRRRWGVGMAQVKQRKSPTRRGRPPGSRYGAVFQLRLSTDTQAAVSKCAAKQGITRSEAMRRLVEFGLNKRLAPLAHAAAVSACYGAAVNATSAARAGSAAMTGSPAVKWEAEEDWGR
jgi:hypothetical protein